jgi:hypothetical protein
MKESNKIITTFLEHLHQTYGKRGSPERMKFEARARKFISRELKKEQKYQKSTLYANPSSI